MVLLDKGLATQFPQVWHVPAENLNFVGREDILQDIVHLFQTSPLKTVVITGLQGFGKSQTAKRFVYQNFANYDVVWWFRANQFIKPQFERFALVIGPSLRLSLEKSIHTIGHEHLVSIIKEGIRRKNLKCLIIFDDAHAYTEIEPYVLFSHDKTVHTLVTTKNGNFSSRAIQIKPFKRQDSLKYINLFLKDDLDHPKDQLAEYLGDCPAALAVAIDYIKSYPSMTIERYLSKHKQQKLNLRVSRIASNKLGSSLDAYETDLLVATQLNMEKLKQHSEEAFALLGLLSLLHRDEIPVIFVESWLKKRKSKVDVMDLMILVNQYSLIEVSSPKEHRRPHMSMQELIQKIVSTLIPVNEKKKLIDEAAGILKQSFSERSDKNVEAILQDNKPLLNTIKLSQEADDLDYHTPNLTFIRIRALDVLVGMIRDFSAAEKIIGHLAKDLHHQISLSKEDEVVYYANMALYAGLHSPDYNKAISYGIKALKLAESEGNMPEEQIRIIANLVQHHSLTGLIDECGKYVERGEQMAHLSQSDAYNALFLLAKNLFLLDKRELGKMINDIRQNQNLLDRQNFYPSMRYFILNQLAEALIKQGDIEEARKVLVTTEKYGREVHGENDQNIFFGKLYILKAMCLFGDKESVEAVKALLQKSIDVYQACFKAPNKHRGQALAHLQLGRLLHQHQDYEQAKASYLTSEAIYDKILKGKQVDDVSDLYKNLAILGADMRDEELTNIYLKKQMAVFGLDHFRTKEIMRYLDERELVLPM